VNLFGEALEKGLKKKFEGHWYPERPCKGSGFRCVRVNGENLDPVMINATFECGLNLEEVKSYLPAELTIWIDPGEVSYRISEKGPVKILHSERRDEEITEKADREVQLSDRGFNPEAQCFKPIDSLSSSLSNLSLSPGGLSPSSPSSSSGWPGSNSTSPSSALFNSDMSSHQNPPQFQQQHQQQQLQQQHQQQQHHQQHQQQQQQQQQQPYVPKSSGQQVFTAASFAATKFGSTKLKTNAKRPTRLSPTEFGNFFRQKSAMIAKGNGGYCSPQRPRSLSPRDPRTEFLLDQHQRIAMSQIQHQHLQQLHQQQRLHSPQHLGPLSSPQHMASPNAYVNESFGISSPSSPYQQPYGNMVDFLPGPATLPSPVGSNAVSPEQQKTFLDGLNMSAGSYQNQYPHMLLAN
jgi:protein Tob/BTG